MKVVILAAGPTEEFEQAGYAYPKNLLEINGELMINRVMRNAQSFGEDVEIIVLISRLEDDRFFTSEIIKLTVPNATVIKVEQRTAGALCTALLAIDLISDDDELVVMNADQLIKPSLFEARSQLKTKGFSAGTICFKTTHPRFSFVRLTDDDAILEASEKRPISQHATAGIYWFSTAYIFKKAAKALIKNRHDFNGRYYVCPVFNELILLGLKCGAIHINPDDYVSFQSPQLLERYLRESSQSK